MVKKKKDKQYELTTTKNQYDMPYEVFAKNRKEALRTFKKKKRKGEKLVSLKRSYW